MFKDLKIEHTSIPYRSHNPATGCAQIYTTVSSLPPLQQTPIIALMHRNRYPYIYPPSLMFLYYLLNEKALIHILRAT